MQWKKTLRVQPTTFSINPTIVQTRRLISGWGGWLVCSMGNPNNQWPNPSKLYNINHQNNTYSKQRNIDQANPFSYQCHNNWPCWRIQKTRPVRNDRAHKHAMFTNRNKKTIRDMGSLSSCVCHSLPVVRWIYPDMQKHSYNTYNIIIWFMTPNSWSRSNDEWAPSVQRYIVSRSNEHYEIISRCIDTSAYWPNSRGIGYSAR